MAGANVVIDDYSLRYDLPLKPCLAPYVAFRLALSTRVPMGIEALPEACERGTPPQPPATGELRLAGRTIGEAFDLLVQADPRYVWAEADGVVVIRPLVAWIDEDHFLHRPMPATSLEDARLTGALEAIHSALRPDRPGVDLDQFAATTTDSAHRFSTELNDSVIESLNAVVRAHGSLFWRVNYCRTPATLDHASILLYTFDGSGFGQAGGLACADAPQ